MSEKKYTLTVAQNGFIINRDYKSYVFEELNALGKWLAEDVKPKTKKTCIADYEEEEEEEEDC